MRYAAYETATGKILQWGVGEPPAGMECIEHDFDGDLADYCVVNGALAPKTPMTLTVSSATPADGVSEAAITGIPQGTQAAFTISGLFYYEQIDDGSLEVSVYDPQTVQVTLWHPLYTHPPVNLVFV